MLERATACLKSRASARESLKCARNALRSNRSLHSTFWNHGAGDLGLPPWALPALPYNDGKRPRGQEKSLKSVETELLRHSHSPPDGLFLDFLYPPQALAWFQRVNAQQYHRWERRNARRLPEGFIVASREYSSRSQRYNQSAHGREADEHVNEAEVAGQDIISNESDTYHTEHPPDEQPETISSDDGLAPFAPFEKQTEDDPSTGAQTFSPFRSTPHQAQESKFEKDLTPQIQWADSPGELAEQSITSTEQDTMHTFADDFEPPEDEITVQNLRNILTFGRGASEERRERLVDRAILVWDHLSESDQDDTNLKLELIELLGSGEKPLHTRCVRLFSSIALGERTLRTYQAILAIIIKRANSDYSYSGKRKYTLLFTILQEALQNIENGHQLSRTIVRYALETEQWRLAIGAALQLHEHYGHDYQSYHLRVFWLHVSETPRLLKAALAVRHWFDVWKVRAPAVDALRKMASGVDAEAKMDKICAVLYKEAIVQEFLHMDGQTSFLERPQLLPLPTTKIFNLTSRIPQLKADGAKLLGDVLVRMLRSQTEAKYARIHLMVSALYADYCATPGAHPSEELFMLWLQRLTEAEDGPAAIPKSDKGMSVERLVAEWERCHTQVSKEALERLMVHYARLGDLKNYDRWLEHFRSVYPSYEEKKDMLWTMVYVHAKRADLDSAQQAFAEVRRMTGEHGDEPDLKSWNVLLTAHSRADDLQGALINFQNLLDSGNVEPDQHSIQPILQLLANRGDVDGVENVLEQCGQLYNTQLTTPLLGSLLLAHVNNDDIVTAESKLKESIPLVKSGVIKGQLTGCFNVILLAHALRRDLGSTLRTYHWMDEERVRLDGDSYAAICQSLIMCGRTGDSFHVMNHYMRQSGIVPTSFHWAIVIAGFVSERRYDQAMAAHSTMIHKGYEPTVSSNIAYLKAKAYRDRRSIGFSTDPIHADDIAVVTRMLADDPGMAAHPTQPIFGLGLPTSDVENKIPAAYVTFLMELYGQKRRFNAVQQLFQLYMEQMEKRGASQSPIPLGILAALAKAYYRTRNHDRIDACWELARAEADRIAYLHPIPTFLPPESSSMASEMVVEETDGVEHSTEGAPENQSQEPQNQVNTTALPDLLRPSETPDAVAESPRTSQLAPARRHVLSRVLRVYLLSKHARNQPLDAIKTVTQLLDQGFALDSVTWNSFIRTLVRRREPLPLLAFVFTERFLAPNFPGWSKKSALFPDKYLVKAASVQKIDTKRFYVPGQLMPRYDTLVALGGALMATRKAESVGFRDVPPELREYIGDIAKVEALAPQTMAIVRNMPNVPGDPLQARARGEYGKL